jgi:phenylpropionate dioxygenase-like ring-hydroxylating dioxygenase large terminal subunit
MFLKNAWYVIAWGEEVGRAILARTVCNESIVVYRTEGGKVAALENACCHRQLPLAMGKLVGDNLQCGYHGLTFDPTGRCVAVPGQSTIPPEAGVRRYPVVEKYRMVWVWLGAPEQADEAKIPHLDRLANPDWVGKTGQQFHLHCNYELLNDNLMDLGHETFVHITSIGSEEVVAAHIKTTRDENAVRVERWMPDHDPAPFWKSAIKLAAQYDGHVDRWQQIEFIPPCNYILHVGVAPVGTGARQGDKSRGIEGCVISINTPETDHTCWQFWTFMRNFQTDQRDVDEKIGQAVHDLLSEDVLILNEQQKNLLARKNIRKVDIGHDAGGIQARRLIQRRLEEEGTLA